MSYRQSSCGLFNQFSKGHSKDDCHSQKEPLKQTPRIERSVASARALTCLTVLLAICGLGLPAAQLPYADLHEHDICGHTADETDVLNARGWTAHDVFHLESHDACAVDRASLRRHYVRSGLRSLSYRVRLMGIIR